MTNELMRREQPAAGEIARQGIGGTEIERRGDTAATAVAAQAKAAIEARYALAQLRPRDFDAVRVRVLKECKRPAFAAVAIYSKPMGGKSIQGPSIRFAEAMLRCMGNVYTPVRLVFESAEQRILEVEATDLEVNVTFTQTVTLNKTVERKKAEGREVLGERLNSAGERLFIVAATEDELIGKQNALISKAVRTQSLRLVPGDLIDEALAMVRKTSHDRAAADPDGEKKLIIDAFAEQGVQPSDLQAYLGHSLDRCTPAELVDLRQVFRAVRDGESNWDEVMESKGGAGRSGSADESKRVAEEKLAMLRGQQKPAQPVADVIDGAAAEPQDEKAVEEPKPRGNNRGFAFTKGDK